MIITGTEYNDGIENEISRNLVYEIFDVKTKSGNEWLGHSYVDNKRDYESVIVFMLDKYCDIEGPEESLSLLDKLKNYIQLLGGINESRKI